MAKIKKDKFIGLRTTSEYYEFIEKQLENKQMTLTEYFNYLIRKELENEKNNKQHKMEKEKIN